MAQQTAVDWLMSEMLKPDMYKKWPTLLERAKVMEKEQIIDAYLSACVIITPYGSYNKDKQLEFFRAENYYNETYNK